MAIAVLKAENEDYKKTSAECIAAQEREIKSWRDSRDGAMSEMEALKAEAERFKEIAMDKELELSVQRVTRRQLLAERYGARTACDALQKELDKRNTEIAELRARFAEAEGMLVQERANNIRLQIRAEDCGNPWHNYPKNQPLIDRSVNEEVLAHRQLVAEGKRRAEGKPTGSGD